MKRLLLRLIISILTFVFSYAVTWVTAYFSDEPKPDQIQAVRQYETKAIRLIQEIGTAQLQYSVTKGRRKFADLETLGREGLLDPELASGKKVGYIFISKPFQTSPYPVHMYDTIAKPVSSSSKALAFYSNETNIVYEITDIESFQVPVENRIPENAIPLQ
jgi:hypothetical protein